MSVGYPLPEDICPDNEYEAWYHAINSLVNFVTSMTQLAVCYSNRLQQSNEYISQGSLVEHSDQEKLKNEPFETSEQIKIISKINKLLEDMPLAEFAIESPHGEPSQKPRIFSLIDTSEFGDVKLKNGEKRTVAPLVKNKTENEAISKPVPITPDLTITFQNNYDLNKHSFITNQIPQTESNGTYFSQYSTDSNQTIDSLNLQENYEAIEIKTKSNFIDSLNKNDQLKETCESSMKRIPVELELNNNKEDTKVLKNLSEEIEQVCLDLDNSESQNSCTSKKSEDSIEEKLKQLQVLEQEINELSQITSNSSKNNINYKSKNSDIMETKLLVPDFAMNPTPKRNNNVDDFTKNKTGASYKDIKNRTQEFNKIQQKPLDTNVESNSTKKITFESLNKNNLEKEQTTKEIQKIEDKVIVKNIDPHLKKNVPKTTPELVKTNKKELILTQNSKKAQSNLVPQGSVNQDNVKKRTTKEVHKIADKLAAKTSNLYSKKTVPKTMSEPSKIQKVYQNSRESQSKKVCQMRANEKRELQKGKLLSGTTLNTLYIKVNRGNTDDLNTRIPIRAANQNACQRLSASVGQVETSKAGCSINKNILSEPKTPDLGKPLIDQKVSHKAPKKLSLLTDTTMKLTKELTERNLLKTDHKDKSKSTSTRIDMIKVAAAENIKKAESLLEAKSRILK